MATGDLQKGPRSATAVTRDQLPTYRCFLFHIAKRKSSFIISGVLIHPV